MRVPFVLTPLVRFGFAVNAEIERDNAGVVAGLRNKYVERLSVAEHRRNHAFKFFFIGDAVLAILEETPGIALTTRRGISGSLRNTLTA